MEKQVEKKSKNPFRGMFSRKSSAPPEIIENRPGAPALPPPPSPDLPATPKGSDDSVARVRQALGIRPLLEPELPPSLTGFERAHDRAETPIRHFLSRSVADSLNVPAPPAPRLDLRPEPQPIAAIDLELDREVPVDEVRPEIHFEIETPVYTAEQPAPAPASAPEAKPSIMAGLKGRFVKRNGQMSMEITGAKAAEGADVDIFLEAEDSVERGAPALEVSAEPLSDEEVAQITAAIASNEEHLLALKRLENEHRSIRKELNRMIARPLQSQDYQAQIEELRDKLGHLKVPQQPRAAPDRGFVLSTGTLFNVTDMIKQLHDVPEGEFAQGVSKGRHALADFVESALGMPELAARLRPLQSKEAVLGALKEWNSAYVRDVNAARKAARDIQNEIREAEQNMRRAKGRYEFKHFFRLHKPESLRSLLKLLQTLEYLYKTETSTVIIHNKEDFNRWVRTFIEGQRRAEAARNAPLKELLQKTLEEHATVIKGDLDRHAADLHARHERVADSQLLLKQKFEELEGARAALEKQKGDALAELAEKRAGQEAELAAWRAQESAKLDEAKKAVEAWGAGERAGLEAKMRALDEDRTAFEGSLDSRRAALEAQAAEALALRRRELDEALRTRIGEFDARQLEIEEQFRAKGQDLEAHYEDEEARCQSGLEAAKAAHQAGLQRERDALAAAHGELEQDKRAWQDRQRDETGRLAALEAEIAARKRELDTILETLEGRKARIEDEHRGTIKILEDRHHELEASVANLERGLDEELAAHRARMAEEARKAKTALAEDRKQFEAFRAGESARLTELQQAVEQEKRRIEGARAELAEQQVQLREEIDAQKGEMRKSLDEMRRLDKSLSDVESHVLSQREALEREGFRKYLEAKLKDLRASSGRKDTAPAGSSAEDTPDVNDALYWDFYKDMARCQSMLSNKQLEAAKALYTDIKNRFNTAQLPQEKKVQLYHSIRELYEDISGAQAA